MPPTIFPNYPPEQDAEQREYLVSSLQDWAIAHGLAVREPKVLQHEGTDPHSVAIPAPVTLFPSPFSRSCFEEGREVQTAYNELYAAIANDEEWLGEIVEELLGVDDFIAQLWQVHLDVKNSKGGYVQDLSLGLFRSDYMIHVDPSIPESTTELKQVEFNTIASSFGGLASKVTDLHKYLSTISAYPPSSLIDPTSMPPNPSIPALSRGLASAHTHYGPSKSNPLLPLCILFIVQNPEQNAFDQKHLEYELQSTHSIPTFRVPFASVLAITSISSNPTRPLIYTPPHSPTTPYEATTCYFRAGYSPADYPDASAWQARAQLESSAAIKCPSILTHLAGSKKIQQVLATPHSPHLTRFLPAHPLAARVLATFTNIYPLDDSPAGLEARKLALSASSAVRYVLKPQREGGGNNVYRAAIPGFLRSMSEDRWKGYILMELIEPPELRNAIVRNGKVEEGSVIGELGVFGACVWRKSEKVELLENWEAGYLLRTKGRQNEEGGVAAGFGAVDSALLVDV
ncbi:MAG: hypothetical protein M1833_000086 [Piccolia ochrophora]|nr:MAG: hypothetical protein M1833_000086 [Piccolia ochrophora]